MGAWGTAFNWISLFYAGVAALTSIRLLRRGKAVFGEPLQSADSRLLSAAAFYLLTPIAVALHELGHVVLVYALGGRIVGVHFLLYWGYVVPDRSFGPYGDFAVALAGNVVTLGLGLAAAWLELRRPSRAAVNLICARLAEIQLSMVLVFYPLMCLIGFGGDFLLIYRIETWPVSAPLLAAHLGFLGWLFWARRGGLFAEFRLHASPLWDEIRRSRRDLQANPSDSRAALRGAWAFLQAKLPEDALPLALLATRQDGSATARAILGQALAEIGDPTADEVLTRALDEQGLDPVLAAQGRLVLAAYLVEKGDFSRAASLAQTTLDAFPAGSDAVEILGRAVRSGAPAENALAALDRAAARGNIAARQELEELQRSLLRRRDVRRESA
jgi:hypothetical protein